MTRTRIITLVLTLAVSILVAAPASAKDGRDVRVAGTCTGSSTAKLKLSPENGRIEVEFEVDQNRNGVAWKIQLFRNGVRIVTTTATTRGPSGSFELRRVVSRAGSPTRISAVATRASGERCTARAAI